MGKTNLERQEALRQRREKLGLNRYEFWLSIKELEAIKKLLKRLRGKQS